VKELHFGVPETYSSMEEPHFWSPETDSSTEEPLSGLKMSKNRHSRQDKAVFFCTYAPVVNNYMSIPETIPELEVCPDCNKSARPDFFKTVGKLRICAFCAQRQERDDQAMADNARDATIHRNLNWLWKYIFIVVGYLLFRLISPNWLVWIKQFYDTWQNR
jgi:hypothetical protein